MRLIKMSFIAITLLTLLFILVACSDEPIITTDEPIITTDEAEPDVTYGSEIQPNDTAYESTTEPARETYSFPFPFSTEDLQGNPVTQDLLGDRALFFVYFWATWCGPCVNGIPGLSQLAYEYGDRIGFITLLDDFDDARDTAIRITEDSDAPFITVNARNNDFNDLMQLINPRFFPTSIIIDANGNMIGEHLIGSNEAMFQAAIEDALNR